MVLAGEGTALPEAASAGQSSPLYWPLGWPPRYRRPRQSKTVQVSFPVSVLAVTPGDIESDSPPAVELGAYQVQIGTPATLSADFSIHS